MDPFKNIYIINTYSMYSHIEDRYTAYDPCERFLDESPELALFMLYATLGRPVSHSTHSMHTHSVRPTLTGDTFYCALRDGNLISEQVSWTSCFDAFSRARTLHNETICQKIFEYVITQYSSIASGLKKSETIEMLVSFAINTTDTARLRRLLSLVQYTISDENIALVTTKRPSADLAEILRILIEKATVKPHIKLYWSAKCSHAQNDTPYQFCDYYEACKSAKNADDDAALNLLIKKAAEEMPYQSIDTPSEKMFMKTFGCRFFAEKVLAAKLSDDTLATLHSEMLQAKSLKEEQSIAKNMYKRLSRTLHPDKSHDAKKSALFTELKNWYERAIDADKEVSLQFRL